MRHKDIQLTEQQREWLEQLWLVYGNDGPKFSMRDHKFIQKILEKGQDWRGTLSPSEECLIAVEAALPKLQPGDTVVIPDRYPLRNKRQSRANIVLAICEDRGWLLLTKILRNGKPSQDRAAEVYWQFDAAHYLERMNK